MPRLTRKRDFTLGRAAFLVALLALVQLIGPGEADPAARAEASGHAFESILPASFSIFEKDCDTAKDEVGIDL